MACIPENKSDPARKFATSGNICYKCHSISKIENLPENIWRLNISVNQVSVLENIPETCRSVNAQSNQIREISTLPSNLIYLCLWNNPIFAITKLMSIRSIIWYSRFKCDTIPVLKAYLCKDACSIIAQYFVLSTKYLDFKPCGYCCRGLPGTENECTCGYDTYRSNKKIYM